MQPSYKHSGHKPNSQVPKCILTKLTSLIWIRSILRKCRAPTRGCWLRWGAQGCGGWWNGNCAATSCICGGLASTARHSRSGLWPRLRSRWGRGCWSGGCSVGDRGSWACDIETPTWTFYPDQLGTKNVGPVTLRHPHEHSTPVNRGLKILDLSHWPTWTFYPSQQGTENLGPVTLRHPHEHSTPLSTGDWKSWTCHTETPTWTF